MSKHIEGPWKVYRPGSHPRHWGVRSDNRRIISEFDVDVPDFECEANARLIAAAPDLLAAVQHVLIASEDNGDMDDIDWQMLRNAIAKAEGQP